MITSCNICGKEIIIRGGAWAYKSGKKVFCSWRCLRTDERKEAETMKSRVILTEEQKRKAVEIAESGGNQMEYLRGLGCANPTTSWKTIKSWWEKNKTVPVEKVSLVYDQQIAEEYKAEKKERFEYDVLAIKSKETGVQYSYEKPCGLKVLIGTDWIVLPIPEWEKILAEVPKAIKLLRDEL